MTVEELRRQIRELLLAKDQDALTELMVSAVFHHASSVIERVAMEELATTPHDVHVWWEGPCNCHGRFN